MDYLFTPNHNHLPFPITIEGDHHDHKHDWLLLAVLSLGSPDWRTREAVDRFLRQNPKSSLTVIRWGLQCVKDVETQVRLSQIDKSGRNTAVANIMDRIRPTRGWPCIDMMPQYRGGDYEAFAIWVAGGRMIVVPDATPPAWPEYRKGTELYVQEMLFGGHWTEALARQAIRQGWANEDKWMQRSGHYTPPAFPLQLPK